MVSPALNLAGLVLGATGTLGSLCLLFLRQTRRQPRVWWLGLAIMLGGLGSTIGFAARRWPGSFPGEGSLVVLQWILLSVMSVALGMSFIRPHSPRDR